MKQLQAEDRFVGHSDSAVRVESVVGFITLLSGFPYVGILLNLKPSAHKLIDNPINGLIWIKTSDILLEGQSWA